MLILKKSVFRIAGIFWAVLWVAAVGLNGWRLKPIESPASLAVSSLACLIVAGVTLAMLISDRARHALADPDFGRATLPLWGMFAGSAFVGAGMLGSALMKIWQLWTA